MDCKGRSGLFIDTGIELVYTSIIEKLEVFPVSVETSRKILKIFGILSIIFGIFDAILAAVLLAGGKAGVASGELNLDVTPEELRLIVFAAYFTIASGLVTFLQGIFSVRAAKNFERIMPAWIFGILGLIFSVINSVWNIIVNTDGKTIFSAVVSVAISVLILAAANKIKKHVGK